MGRAFGYMLVAFMLGCAGFAAHSSPAPALRGVARRTRCVIQGAALRCGAVRYPLSDLGVALPLRASAPRRLGGLWLLDAERALARVDAHGRVTGRAVEAGEVLLTSAEFVCTGAGVSPWRCLVDHHDDAGCAAETALSAQAIDPGFVPARALSAGVLCGATSGGALRCARLTRPCGLGCLRFPACSSALQCIVGCPPGQPSIAARLLDPAQFGVAVSSFAPLAVTQAHGRPQGGYAAERARQ